MKIEEELIDAIARSDYWKKFIKSLREQIAEEMLIEGSTRRETETRTITLQGKYKRTAYARSFGRELTGYTVKINRNQKPTNYKLL